MIKNDYWKIGFFNAGQTPADEHFFGCTVAASVDENGIYAASSDDGIIWKEEQVGAAIFGSYDECVQDLAKLSIMTVPAALLLFSLNKSIAKRFAKQVRRYFPNLPFAGGVAAGGANGELRPNAQDLCALFIYDNPYLIFSEVLPAENEIFDKNVDREKLMTERLGTFVSGKENSLILISEGVKRGLRKLPKLSKGTVVVLLRAAIANESIDSNMVSGLKRA